MEVKLLMDNPLDIIIDIILTIIIILIFPLLYLGMKQDSLTQTIVEVETNSFVQEVRSKGYIDKDMYEGYIENLSATGILYDIEIEHNHNSLEPEYRFPTEEEVIDEHNKSYTGTNEYHYWPITTEIPHIEDPIDNRGNLNSETNESIMEAAISMPADSSHIHNESCYIGHRHGTSGCNYRSGHTHSSSCYHSHTDSCYTICSGSTSTRTYTSTHNCGGTWTIYGYYCNLCGNYTSYVGLCSNYKYSDPSTHGCVGGQNLGPSPPGTRGHKKTLTCSISTIYTQCGQSSGPGGWSCGISQDTSYDCNQIIDSIAPTHPIQTVYINDPLITTARATYKDGSQKTHICTTNFDTSQPVINKTAILIYNYSIDGVAKSIQTTITVSIILRSKTCNNGHVYNLNSDNTDPGCPFCRGYLQSLVVFYPSSGSITIYKGRTLEENEVTLLATYMDGRKEYIRTEYVDNLDKDYIGTQTATLSYKGHYTSLSVTIKRNLMLCPICNKYYELYPDNTDPGCPYCAALTPIFTGNILEYENKYYERDILNEIYDGNEVYYFSNKDYLLMTINNRTSSWGRGLLKKIFKSMGNEYIYVVDGGYIREEVQK